MSAPATFESFQQELARLVERFDHDIDQLVYQLYALTPEEIALVEGLPASGAGAGAPDK